MQATDRPSLEQGQVSLPKAEPMQAGPASKPVAASTRSPCLAPPYEPYLCLRKHLQEADRRPLSSRLTHIGGGLIT